MELTTRLLAAALPLLTLDGCSTGAPVTEGVWSADDGSATKTIGQDGTCSGMYYDDGEPLDIGGPMTCRFGVFTDGTAELVVEQPPNQATYSVTFGDDDTMRLDTGAGVVTLTRQ